MTVLPNIQNSIIQKIAYTPIVASGVSLYIKRDDLIHEFVSGNKFRKMKYNLAELKDKGFSKMITFGGAYSNHIAAVAATSKMEGVASIGIIRGEELGVDLEKTLKTNPTLRFAASQGMQFEFVTRSEYREKNSQEFIDRLLLKYGDSYIVPEGGTNPLAVKGAAEILNDDTASFDVIASAVGTGGTIAGLINGSHSHQNILGFPALKGDFLNAEISKYIDKKNWELTTDYHFGGYAKTSDDLIIFINRFKEETGIPLDPVYTGKMFFGLVDMIQKGKFQKGTKILAIHTGGLQGIKGMNQLLEKKKRITIN